MKGRIDRHARYRELLAARLDRQLTRVESRLLVGHLKACLDCQQVERDYRDQSALLRSLPTPTPPRDMWARTSTALDREMSRWSFRYPRLGRRVARRAGRARSGAPSALATVVAALGIVTVFAVMQLGPAPRQAPGTAVADGSAPSLRPTPFSIAAHPFAVVSAGESDLTVFRTQLSEVCPTTAPDCTDDKVFDRQSVSVPNLRPQNVAMSASGGQIAFVGHDKSNDVITVVLLLDDAPAKTSDPEPTDSPAPPSSSPANQLPPPETPAANQSPPALPEETGPAVEPSPDPGATDVATPETPDPQATPPEGPADTPEPVDPVATALVTPPPSAVPGLRVLSILEDVHSAGAPPAWSRDGEVLAFSAMPADGSHGPDVFVWEPGDTQARAITTDHSSFFASWSGRRIVVSRVNDTSGKSDTLEVLTVVVDPVTLEERRVDGPMMWLPVVDPEQAHAVTWNGRLDLSGSLPVAREGALYLVDWSAVDPFGAEAGSGDVELVALDPTRDPVAEPVLDWHARWSADGRVLGLWEADTPGESWGRLVLVAFDPNSGELTLDEPLIGPEFSKRGFTVGANRVAWVGPPNDGTEGELHIRTWGTDGVGDLRIESLNVEDLVPTF
ncbi:MAG: hypothetical protein WD830_02220 [Chloroflexota bacterium]